MAAPAPAVACAASVASRPAVVVRPRAAAAACCKAPQLQRKQHRQQQQQQQRRRMVSRAAPSSSSGLSAVEEDRLCEEMAEFLRQDLPHLFDDQGIDASKYDDKVVFEDPITKYDSIQGYLFNIAFLRRVFAPTFVLHDVRRTGPLQLTTRWTMDMTLAFAPGGTLRRLWDPRLVFTGTSIMGINPLTRRFCSHADTWDAVQQQGYFSFEAFTHMLSQVADLRRRPDGSAGASSSSPPPEVLKKRAAYEVRLYPAGPPHGAVAQDGAPAVAATSSSGEGVFAVAEFTGEASEAAAAATAQALRRALAADGLQPAAPSGWLLRACPPDVAPAPLRANEVLVPLQGFQLW